MRHYCHSQCFFTRDPNKENKLVIGEAVGNAGTNVKMAQYTLPVKIFCSVWQL